MSACLPDNPAYAPITETPSAEAIASTATLQPSQTFTATATDMATPTPTQTISPTPPQATATATPTPTPVVFQTVAAGELDIPILLYHHILSSGEKPDTYSLNINQFKDQMALLRDWGYTPMLITPMLNLLRTGGSLPLRPVIITFDDGNRDVYQNAFPVLKSLNYPAVMYVIAKSIDAGTNLNKQMIVEMVGAGWEIGSHSYSHVDLTKSDAQQKEICLSKQTIEAVAGVPVTSFSYPYGLADSFLKQYVRDCGYTSGAGLGPSYHHSLSDVFYFQRLPIDGTWSLAEFGSRLPWKGP